MCFMTFTAEFKEIANRTNQKVEDVVKLVAKDLFKLVIDGTPVGNPQLWKSNPPKDYVAGLLKGNWQTTIGSPSVSKVATKDIDGKMTTKKMMSVVNKWDGTGFIYFTNNLPYAARIEYGAHSTQAPSGMVRVALSTVEQSVNKAINKVA